MSKVADSIRRGLREAAAYADGKADESAYRVHVPVKIDVNAIRAGLVTPSAWDLTRRRKSFVEPT